MDLSANVVAGKLEGGITGRRQQRVLCKGLSNASDKKKLLK